jgi:ubiquinone/menaquinone biosynthesis C-methylase UbiE
VPSAPFDPDAYGRWFTTPLGRRVWADELRVLDRLLPTDLPGRRILDLGCGDGRFAEHVRARGGWVTGIDLSGPMIRAAAQRLHASDSRPGPRGVVRLVRADAALLPVRDHTVDVVTIVTLLAFVPEPAAVIREAARVLRPDGLLILGALGRRSIWAAVRRFRAWFGDRTWRGARFWTAAELRLLLLRADLEVVDQSGAIPYPPAFIALAARKGPE